MRARVVWQWRPGLSRVLPGAVRIRCGGACRSIDCRQSKGCNVGKLKGLGSPIKTVRPRISTLEVDHDTSRKQRHKWRAWYGTARWQRLRWSILERALFTCVRCGRCFGDTSQLVADHIEQHKGDPGKFWDEANLQCMCKGCHDRDKQREERAGGW